MIVPGLICLEGIHLRLLTVAYVRWNLIRPRPRLGSLAHWMGAWQPRGYAIVPYAGTCEMPMYQA